MNFMQADTQRGPKIKVKLAVTEDSKHPLKKPSSQAYATKQQARPSF